MGAIPGKEGLMSEGRMTFIELFDLLIFVATGW
jgi:hypothetical protein